MNSTNTTEKMDQEYLEDEDTLKDKYLTFHIGNEDFGIEIRHVIEIIGIQKITEVPDSPPHVKGVINLRGKVVPITDVRLRFGMPEKEYDERTCVIVVNIDESSVGLVVDTVSDVATIPQEDIESGIGSRKEQETYIQGLGKIGDEIKILLDIQKFLFEDLEIKKQKEEISE